ncbi:beta-1,4-galactosyltransferase 1 [Aplochiton taeniatus]
MKKQLFILLMVLCGLCFTEYAMFYLKQTSILIVAVRLYNKTAGGTKANHLVHKLVLDLWDKKSKTEFNNQSKEPVGPLRIEFSSTPNLEVIRNKNPHLQAGGRFRPAGCVALQKVAIVIPFRRRQEHLKHWLFFLHPILQRQQLDYGIYIINQAGEVTFNRAKLMNIGYAEALKDYDYDCVVFSDIDLVPMDDRNIYKCSNQPRHLSVSIDKFGFRLPYPSIFGGVTALTKEQFLKINGYPNNYWGWGGEDDDASARITHAGMSISRPDGVIGKYRMIVHDRDKHNEANPGRTADLLQKTIQNMNNDGIKSLEYKVLQIEKDLLFTNITVDAGSPP